MPPSEFDNTLNHIRRLFDVDPCGAVYILDRYQALATNATVGETEAALNQACAEWQESQHERPT